MSLTRCQAQYIMSEAGCGCELRIMAEDNCCSEPNHRAKLHSYIGSWEFATVCQRKVATSQLRNFATSQPRNFATSQPRNLATSQLRNFATLQLCNSATLQLCNFATSQRCVGTPWQTPMLLCNFATSPCDLARYLGGPSRPSYKLAVWSTDRSMHTNYTARSIAVDWSKKFAEVPM